MVDFHRVSAFSTRLRLMSKQLSHGMTMVLLKAGMIIYTIFLLDRLNICVSRGIKTAVVLYLLYLDDI